MFTICTNAIAIHNAALLYAIDSTGDNWAKNTHKTTKRQTYRQTHKLFDDQLNIFMQRYTFKTRSIYRILAKCVYMYVRNTYS